MDSQSLDEKYTTAGSSISLNDLKNGGIGDLEELGVIREPTCALRKRLPSPRSALRRRVYTPRGDGQDTPGSALQGAFRWDPKSAPVTRRLRMRDLGIERPPTSPVTSQPKRTSSPRSRLRTKSAPLNARRRRRKSPAHSPPMSPQESLPKSRKGSVKRRRTRRRASRVTSRRRRTTRRKSPRHLSSAEEDSEHPPSPLWLQGSTIWQRTRTVDYISSDEDQLSRLLPGGRFAKIIPLLPPETPRTPSPTRPLRLLQDVTSTLATGTTSLSLTSNSGPLVMPSLCMKPRATQWPSASGKRANTARLSPTPTGSPNRESPACCRRRPRRTSGIHRVPLDLLPPPHRLNITLPRLLLDARTVPVRFDKEREKIMGTRNYLRLFFPQKWQEHEMQKRDMSSRTRRRRNPAQSDSAAPAPNTVLAKPPTSRAPSPSSPSPSPQVSPPVVPRLQRFPQMTRRCRLTSNITLAQYISNVMGFVRDSYFRNADDENSPATE